MSEPILVIVKKRFEVSPERVYDAFLDPNTAGRFMFATPGGQMLIAEVDPRVGGRFRFLERRPVGDIDHTGEFLELLRPSKITFNFGAALLGKSPDGWTKVTIEIAPLTPGCELTLTHEMARAWEAHQEKVSNGWKMILEGLSKTLPKK